MSDNTTVVGDDKKRNNVPIENFIDAYMRAHQEGKSERDVASILNLQLPSVTSRANSLRKKGANLPRLNNGLKGIPKLNIDSINKLIEGHKV